MFQIPKTREHDDRVYHKIFPNVISLSITKIYLLNGSFFICQSKVKPPYNTVKKTMLCTTYYWQGQE